ncbi:MULTISPECIES: 2OG-Fe dioxygenase family protein [unclassified Luteibacter]|uniref:2OG-Fe dioxygenase family protein n=1 Tax=Luteibacter sp. PvP019 TaxID=3156436 RepID=UPI003397DB1E
MNAPLAVSESTLHDQVRDEGFAFVQGDAMRGLVSHIAPLTDWDTFAASWNALEPDTYLAATGRFRRRRHAVFTASRFGHVEPRPHQAHFQTLAYNTLQGDIARWFAPVLPEIAGGATMSAILDFCRDIFGGLSPTVETWHVEVHQFRIEATAGVAGEPTPEGSHRDGVDYVLVLLVDRENIASGTTTIHTPDGRPLGEFTLTRPLDAALIHDPRVFHGVTPVTPLDASKASHRDVLVVTFRAA